MSREPSTRATHVLQTWSLDLLQLTFEPMLASTGENFDCFLDSLSSALSATLSAELGQVPTRSLQGGVSPPLPHVNWAPPPPSRNAALRLRAEIVKGVVPGNRSSLVLTHETLHRASRELQPIVGNLRLDTQMSLRAMTHVISDCGTLVTRYLHAYDRTRTALADPAMDRNDLATRCLRRERDFTRQLGKLMTRY